MPRDEVATRIGRVLELVDLADRGTTFEVDVGAMRAGVDLDAGLALRRRFVRHWAEQRSALHSQHDADGDEHQHGMGLAPLQSGPIPPSA